MCFYLLFQLNIRFLRFLYDIMCSCSFIFTVDSILLHEYSVIYPFTFDVSSVAVNIHILSQSTYAQVVLGNNFLTEGALASFTPVEP